MFTQINYLDEFSEPEVEYKINEMRKRLQYSMANFAQIRYRRQFQKRITIDNNKQ